MKIYEIAKEYELGSKEVLAICKKLSIAVKSHLNSVSDEELANIKKAIESAKKPVVQAAAKAEPVQTKPLKSETVKMPEPVVPAAPDLIHEVGGDDKSGLGAAAKKVDKKTASDLLKKRIAEKLQAPSPAMRPRPVLRRGQQKIPSKAASPVEAITEAIAQDREDERQLLPGQKLQPPRQAAGKDKIQVRFPLSVGALATKMEVKTSELIKSLMEEGIFANVNQLLNEEIVRKVVAKFQVGLDVQPTEEEELILTHEEDDDPKELKLRPPVVTLMGHVDHGKTSLLDAVRNSRLVDREAGRITQHIGAYSVPIEGKGEVTFLDTPGHEAFTAMRARGANVTDVVVLVVAADDGVMPQTVEAINHARAANVPIVVAVNKSDLPTASTDRVKAELQKYGLVAEDWGGKTIMVNVSALKRTGIQELLEMLLLEAEILDLKANPNKRAQGIVLEAEVTRNHGTVTHALVTSGTLKIGDYVICGSYFGKVRAMHNELGKNIKAAGPSKPVEIFGVQGVPNAADQFYVVSDEKTARRIAEQKGLELRERALNAKLTKHTTLESLFDKMKEGQLQDLKIIIKADVQGSLEVLQQSLEKLSTEKITLKVIHAAVGGINESDVMLATVSDAIVIGFHVKAGMKAQELIDREGIDVRYYKIIYEAIEDVKIAMEGKLAPTFREVVMGMVEVRSIFKASKIGTIGGCYVLKGKIARSHKIRVLRDDIVVHEGDIGSLRRFKDDAREVKENTECGITISNYNDLQEGDRIESYVYEEVAAKL